MTTLTRRAANRVNQRIYKTVLIVFGTTAAFLSGEVGLRSADRLGLVQDWQDIRTARTSSIWMKSENPKLVYRHRPNYIKDGIRYTEKHGLLQPEDASLAADDSVFRIVALGDSVGAAIKLPYQKRVFTLVQQALSSRLAPRVELLNFSVNGYSTLQEAAMLEELASRFEPDFLILQYCVNDFYPTEYPMYWFLDYSPSYLVEYVSRALSSGVPKGYPPAEYWAKMYETDTYGWKGVAEGFGSIADYCKSRAIPCLLTIFPAVSKGGWEAGDASTRHRRVSKLAQEKGFAVLDLLSVFAEHPVDSFRVDPWDTFHLNAEGHRLAADSIVEMIGLIQRRANPWQ